MENKYKMISYQNIEEKDCICDRKQTTLFCTKCISFSFGRILRRCNKHKKVKFLMDLEMCPRCKTSKENLREINVDKHDAKALSSVKL